MREFFRGWKRKLGVLALVISCAFTGEWIRSLYLIDGVEVVTGPQTQWRLFSRESKLHLICENHYLVGFKRVKPLQWTIGAKPVKAIANGTFSVPYDVIWRFELAGIRFAAEKMGGQIRVDSYVIPYWSIVLPLNLLSAYLVLSKPRNLAKAPA